MSDYKFDKPWAAESQNVQDFTEEEWGTGIVEKSLASSSQVNGVMQAVTKRFLDLEAVEDRQYRYKFVVDDEESWNNFITGNIPRLTETVVIREGTWVADTKVKLTYPNFVAIESGAIVQFNSGVDRSTDSSPITIFGGQIIGSLTNCTLISSGVVALSSLTFVQTVFENSTLFVPGNHNVSGGSYFNSVINSQGGISSAKFVDCEIKSVKTLTNCTLVRCTIPANTSLAYCTVIDCDYTVDTFTANLITSTTFRNCNIAFTTTTEETGAVCDSSNKAYGSRIEFHLTKSEHVSMIIYDSEIKFYRSQTTINSPLFTDSSFFGTSYMDVSGTIDSDLIKLIDRFNLSRGSIMTSIPFFREDRYFSTLSAKNTVYPGIINLVNANTNMVAAGSSSRNKYFVNFAGSISNNTPIAFGIFQFLPWCRYSNKLNSQQYNLEFVIDRTL